MTPDTDIVERVARAICDDIDDGLPAFTRQKWEDLTPLARATLRKRARAAIEAMREPETAPPAANDNAALSKERGDE